MKCKELFLTGEIPDDSAILNLEMPRGVFGCLFTPLEITSAIRIGKALAATEHDQICFHFTPGKHYTVYFKLQGVQIMTEHAEVSVLLCILLVEIVQTERFKSSNSQLSRLLYDG